MASSQKPPRHDLPFLSANGRWFILFNFSKTLFPCFQSLRFGNMETRNSGSLRGNFGCPLANKMKKQSHRNKERMMRETKRLLRPLSGLPDIEVVSAILLGDRFRRKASSPLPALFVDQRPTIYLLLPIKTLFPCCQSLRFGNMETRNSGSLRGNFGCR